MMTQGPIYRPILITGGTDIRKNSMQSGLGKIKPMDKFELNKLKSGIN